MLRRPLASGLLFAGCLGLLGAGLGSACSATPNGAFGAGGGGVGGTTSATGTPTTTVGTNTGSTGSMGGAIGFMDGGLTSTGTGSGGGPVCAASKSKGEQAPLDMYIMEDQSGSMNDMVASGGTKWQAVTSAITAFVDSPAMAVQGISVGIQYFALPPGGAGPSCACAANNTCPMAGDFCVGGTCVLCELQMGGGSDSCNGADYAKPEVPITALPAGATAITTSLGKHMPSTGTPTMAAMQGAVQYAQTWATAHPGHVVVAVLATDGEPEECDQSTTDIANVAAMGVAGPPSVKTFTIGVFAPGDIPSGPNLLNAIAAAGGTGQAFVIQTANPGMNVQQQFLAALNAIRGTALGCSYQIPPENDGGTIDFTKVNVEFTPGGGAGEELGKVTDAASCPASGDAWYYDDNAAPTQILLCPSTCTKVQADAMGGEVDILLGCQTMMSMAQ